MRVSQNHTDDASLIRGPDACPLGCASSILCPFFFNRLRVIDKLVSPEISR